MNHIAGILAFIGLAVGLDACIRTINARETNGGLPLVHASEPASVVPWRLLTACPIDRRNIPRYSERVS